MFPLTVLAAIVLGQNPSATFDVEAGATGFGTPVRIALHDGAAEFEVRAKPAGETPVVGEIWYYDKNGEWIGNKFRSEVIIKTGNVKGEVWVRFKSGKRATAVRVSITGSYVQTGDVSAPFVPLRTTTLPNRQEKEEREAPKEIHDGGMAEADERNVSQIREREALIAELVRLRRQVAATRTVGGGASRKPSSPTGLESLPQGRTDAITPSPLPRLEPPPATGIVTRFQISQLIPHRSTSTWLELNPDDQDNVFVKLSRGPGQEERIPGGSDTWKANKSIRQKTLWEGIIAPGDSVAFTVEFYHQPTSIRAFVDAKFIGRFRVTIRNEGGRLQTGWEPGDDAREVPIFEGGSSSRANESFRKLRPNERRIKMTGTDSDYDAFLAVFDVDAERARREAWERDAPNRKEGKLDPDSGLGKRIREWSEQHKKELEDRQRRLQQRRPQGSNQPAPSEGIVFPSERSLVLQQAANPAVAPPPAPPQEGPVLVPGRPPGPSEAETFILAMKELAKWLADKGVEKALEGLPPPFNTVATFVADVVKDPIGTAKDDTMPPIELRGELNAQLNEFINQAKSLDQKAATKAKQKTESLERKKTKIVRRRQELDEEEMKLRAWAEEENAILSREIDAYNQRTGQLKSSISLHPPPSTIGQEDAYLAALRRELDTMRFETSPWRCPNGHSWNGCTHYELKNQYLANRRAKEATYQTLLSQASQRRAAYETAVRESSPRRADLYQSYESLKARIELYHARIRIGNEKLERGREECGRAEHEMEGEERDIVLLKELSQSISKALLQIDRDKDVAIHQLWLRHPRFKPH